MGNRRPGRRFLVVDDEPLIGAAFERVLFPDYVERCMSAEDAIGVLETGAHFDALVTDLMLPGRTGVELYEWVQSHRISLCAHTLFMTGSPHSPLARRAQALSAHPLLVKPFSLTDVRHAVAGATGKLTST